MCLSQGTILVCRILVRIKALVKGVERLTHVLVLLASLEATVKLVRNEEIFNMYQSYYFIDNLCSEII